MDKTIIYYTDNSLDKNIAGICKAFLRKSSQYPILWTYQPHDWNRCYLSIVTLLRRALKHIETPNVALAEHDCIYTKEHFEFIPEREDTMYFNTNVKYINLLHDGIISDKGKNDRPLSQLICNKYVLDEFLENREYEFRNPQFDFNPEKKFDPYEDGLKIETFETVEPNFDIKHETNFTGHVFHDGNRLYVHK